MSIVLDTNVLISAFLFRGLSASVYDYCVLQANVYLSEWIMEEFLEKLEQKFAVNLEKRKAIEEVIRDRVIISEPTTLLPTICRDEDDNHVLQIAESVSAKFLITGDKDLLVLKEYKNIKILTPGAFNNIVVTDNE
jgi:putative PIN family toxin of toxin-antitoxin system